MSISVRGIFLGLIVAASLTACSLPGYAEHSSAAPPPAAVLTATTASTISALKSTTPAPTARQKLQTLVDTSADFTAHGADLTAVVAAMAHAKTLLIGDYGLPQFRMTPDFAGADATLTAAKISATAEGATIEAARLAAEAQAAREAAVREAATNAAAHAAAVIAAEQAARSTQNAVVRAAPRVTAPPAPTVYELRVVGVARNQADIDRCGLMDVTAWMGVRELATHWSCGRGSDIPRSAGQLFVVTGAGALNGNYVSLGVVGTLNQKTQTSADIPRNYDLIVSSCLNNDSTRMMLLALTRTP